MNLLDAKNYDPAGAVSKVTTSLIAMTAFDTTNLRLTVTVPAHGMLFIKMQCVHHGSTTTSQVLLGCLEGSTVRGRQAVTRNLLGTAIATTLTKLEVEYTLTGLTPGSMVLDAAYGVEIVSSAGGAIKYGGPNNTTTNDAFGGFNFEVWDPRPLKLALDGGVNVTQFNGTNATAASGRPEVNTTHWNGTAVSTPATAGIPDVNVKNINNVAAATPGASGGILISGSNSGTTTLAALTVTGATTLTGNVAAQAGVNITQSSANTSALVITGNGTGHGAVFTSGGGATGDGVQITSAATNGNGLKLTKVGTGVALASPTTDIALAKTTNITGFNDIAATAVVSSGAITTSGGAVSTVTSVTGAVGSVTGNVGGNVTGSIGSVAADGITAASIASDVTTELRSVVSGTADSGTTTTMVDAARTEADTNYWKGDYILFTSGTIAGQCRLITAFTPGTDTITFSPATTQAVGTNTYEILPGARSDVNSWVGTTVTGSLAGYPDVNTMFINSTGVSTPGASGGLLISGSNSGTTTFSALTVTGATTLTGTVAFNNGITVSRTTANSNAVTFTGNGSGQGLVVSGGATGSGATITGGGGNSVGFSVTGSGSQPGLSVTGGATGNGATIAGGVTSGMGVAISTTSGDGLSILPTAGNAITATGNGSSKHGIIVTGGTAGTSDGVKAVAGTGGVAIRGDITGSITGNITGNLSGSIGSVAANGITASSVASDATAEIAGVVWDVDLASHLGAGTTGEALSNADDAVLAQIALVKAKTDSLTFTVAGQLDSNIQYVNDTQVTGTGATGDTWRPA